MQGVMMNIGHFQLEENNLDHIRGIDKIKQQLTKVEQVKEYRRRATLQIP